MAVGGGRLRLAHLLLLVLFGVVLWVPFYNRLEPQLAGIPFFYWYQLAMIPAGALLLLVIYRAENRAKRDPE